VGIGFDRRCNDFCPYFCFMCWGCEASSMGGDLLKHLCKAVGCGRIVESKSSYCPLHEYKQREDDGRKMKWLSGQFFKYREPWHEWYNTTRWRKLRDSIIKSNPECVGGFLTALFILMLMEISSPERIPQAAIARKGLMVLLPQ
jgi:hypothetical protein